VLGIEFVFHGTFQGTFQIHVIYVWYPCTDDPSTYSNLLLCDTRHKPSV